MGWVIFGIFGLLVFLWIKYVCIPIDKDGDYYIRNGIPPKHYFTVEQQEELAKWGIDPWKGKS